VSLVAAGRSPALPTAPDRPPGERYFRHPGDIVRLCVWATATLVLLLFVLVATDSSDGVRRDLADVGATVTLPVRQLFLAGVQVSALLVPIGVVAALVARRRWRRLGTVLIGAIAGAAVVLVLEALIDEPAPIPGAIAGDAWLMSTRFPTLAYVGAAVAAGTVGKPWMSRRWRRAVDVLLAVLCVTMALAGNAGVPELLLGAAAGGLAGTAVLVALGAPNRRPTPASIRDGLVGAGIAVQRLDVERAVGGRAQLYRAATMDGAVFAKVYSQDSRDADLLYRSYRTAVLREPGASSTSLASNVEHEALLLLLAERGGVACPAVRAVVALPDGSMVLAMEDVGGQRLDAVGAADIDAGMLDDVWRQVAALHRCGESHGALRAANVLVTAAGSVRLIDFGAGSAAATPREQSIDRAELLASLASIVGPGAAVASAGRVLAADDLATAMPYLQPLALSAATRRSARKSMLKDLRSTVAETTSRDQVPLERLVRVRPRTLIMIATLTGAFYVLLPQLANVDDSVSALGSANWWWLAGAVAMSAGTYLAAAVGMIGGVADPLPLMPTLQVALASSFVNRVTPANVGGMALNVRYMQKAGIGPAEAVTGVGLNVAAGGIVHAVLLIIFFAWARQGDAGGFALPGGSKLLIAIPIVLALVGIVMATRRGRGFVRRRVLPSVRQSLVSMASVARSPARLAALFGGSIGVTLGYITALACSLAAFDAGLSYAQVGAVYLGASLIAAAAPTPGGLGALEAALVAGCTGLGVEPSIAVAAVLSYRLLTFWLPILPGWLCFHLLDRRNYI
jgi:undecaprenyl-diphosphatase